MKEPAPLLWDLAEAAKALRVSARTLYLLATERKVPFVRIGSGRGRLLFPVEGLREWVRHQTVQPEAPADLPLSLPNRPSQVTGDTE